MSEKADSAQDDFDRNVRKVKEYKMLYNQTIQRLKSNSLEVSAFDGLSLNNQQTQEDLSEEDKLKLDIGVKLNDILDKQGKKHDDKTHILTVALEVLNGSATVADLEQAKTTYPDYNKALFASETQKLVDAVIALKGSAPTAQA